MIGCSFGVHDMLAEGRACARVQARQDARAGGQCARLPRARATTAPCPSCRRRRGRHMPISVKKLIESLRASMKASTSAWVL